MPDRKLGEAFLEELAKEADAIEDAANNGHEVDQRSKDKLNAKTTHLMISIARNGCFRANEHSQQGIGWPQMWAIIAGMFTAAGVIIAIVKMITTNPH